MRRRFGRARARKGAKLAPDLATVTWSPKTQMGRPSHGRRNARRASTPTTLGPEGAVEQTSKLATDARQGESLRGRRAAADGPRVTLEADDREVAADDRRAVK